MPRVLVAVCLASTFAAPSFAQLGAIDFQVINLHFAGSLTAISGIPTGPAYLAIRSLDELSAWRNSKSIGSLPAANAGESTESLHAQPRFSPAIDFNHSTLLVAEAGRKGTGGYAIVFSSVFESSTGIDVHLFEIGPGRGCAVTSMLSYPATFALISRTDKPIRFKVTNAIRDCTSR